MKLPWMKTEILRLLTNFSVVKQKMAPCWDKIWPWKNILLSKSICIYIELSPWPIFYFRIGYILSKFLRTFNVDDVIVSRLSTLKFLYLLNAKWRYYPNFARGVSKAVIYIESWIIDENLLLLEWDLLMVLSMMVMFINVLLWLSWAVYDSHSPCLILCD